MKFGNDKGKCKFCGRLLGWYDSKFYNTETGELSCGFGAVDAKHPLTDTYPQGPWRYYTDG